MAPRLPGRYEEGYKEPLRKRFAKKARHGALGTFIALGSVLTVGAGAGYGSWYGLNTLTEAPWDTAPTELREPALEKLATEFSRLTVLENALDVTKEERKYAYSHQDTEGYDALTESLKAQISVLEKDVSKYSGDLILARDIDERDYQDLGDQLNDSDLAEFSNMELNTSWGEASARQECDLEEDRENTSGYYFDNGKAKSVNSCMRYADNDLIEPLIMFPTAFLLAIFMIKTGGNPIPEKWEKLPNKPRRGGGGSAESVKDRARRKLPFLRQKPPSN